MSEHTPGEWLAATTTGQERCIISGNQRIADVWTDADAYLITAAPEMLALVKRAATESVVTGGEYGGPGCFYCDTEDGHTKDCPAAAALAKATRGAS